jgi:hypothetical protein
MSRPVVLLVVGILTSAVSACWWHVGEAGYVNGYEDDPCTGSCSSYTQCPQDRVCVPQTPGLVGNNNCMPRLVSTSRKVFAGGEPDPENGCCVGGVFQGYGGGSCLQVIAVLGGRSCTA